MPHMRIKHSLRIPTASVVLHFCVDQTYPILDFRAIWNLGIEKSSQYTIAFWNEYVKICRSVVLAHNLPVRELDMELTSAAVSLSILIGLVYIPVLILLFQ